MQPSDRSRRVRRDVVWIAALVASLVGPSTACPEDKAPEPSAPPATAAAPAEPSADLNALSLEELLTTSVTTVSRTPQRIADAPGVVTVVTQAEIQAMGARTLADILWTIPGFIDVQDNNEHIVAVRGVFATTNQKILVLRDGHRLNEFLFENFEPDYSIALGNVRKIEIVRGPGASLYGNAALTAVINIITEDATYTQDKSVGVSAGIYGQRRVEAIYRNKWGDANLMLFGKWGGADGQNVPMPASQDYPSKGEMGNYVQRPGTAIVDRYEDNVDLGMKLNDGIVTLSGSIRRSNYTQPKGNSGQNVVQSDLFHPLGQIFNYSYLDLQLTPTWGPVQLTLRHYFDYSSYESWQYTAAPTELLPRGSEFSLNWAGSRAGVEYSGLLSHQRGDVLVGFSVERRQMDESFFRSTYDVSHIQDPKPDNALIPRTPLVPPGIEYNGAIFAQFDSAILPSLRVNVGARYDVYQGFGSSFNPRLALIFSPLEDLTAKLIYARAFQAPTYFYRKSNSALGYGSNDDLKPEVMNSLQASVGIDKGLRWSGQVTYFRNDLSNQITRASNDKPSPPYVYKNINEITMQGLEVEAKGRFGPVQAIANCTLQAPVVHKTAAAQVKNGKLAYIPASSGNLGVTYRPLTKVSLNVTAHAESRIYAPTPFDAMASIDPRVVFNATAGVEDAGLKGLRLALSAYNVLDKQYALGGTGVAPYPQPGRWWLVTADYTF